MTEDDEVVRFDEAHITGILERPPDILLGHYVVLAQAAP
jgi:hypothetical protein